MTSKFDQGFLVFFDGGYNLELESSLTIVWVIESPESSSPFYMLTQRSLIQTVLTYSIGSAISYYIKKISKDGRRII